MIYYVRDDLYDVEDILRTDTKTRESMTRRSRRIPKHSLAHCMILSTEHTYNLHYFSFHSLTCLFTIFFKHHTLHNCLYKHHTLHNCFYKHHTLHNRLYKHHSLHNCLCKHHTLHNCLCKQHTLHNFLSKHYTLHQIIYLFSHFSKNCITKLTQLSV